MVRARNSCPAPEPHILLFRREKDYQEKVGRAHTYAVRPPRQALGRGQDQGRLRRTAAKHGGTSLNRRCIATTPVCNQQTRPSSWVWPRKWAQAPTDIHLAGTRRVAIISPLSRWCPPRPTSRAPWSDRAMSCRRSMVRDESNPAQHPSLPDTVRGVETHFRELFRDPERRMRVRFGR